MTGDATGIFIDFRTTCILVTLLVGAMNKGLTILSVILISELRIKRNNLSRYVCTL